MYANPGAYPPVIHTSGIFANAGWKVELFAAGSKGTERINFPHIGHVSVHRFPSKGPGWIQRVKYIGFVLWATVRAMFSRPQCIYASDPLSCPPALAMKFFVRDASLVYHEHDIPTNIGASPYVRLIRLFRRELARRADAVVVPNEGRIAHLPPVRGVNVFVVPNYPRRSEVRPSHTPVRDGMRIVYAGSISPERLPVSVIEALEGLPTDVTLHIIGYVPLGQNTYARSLQLSTAESSVGSRVIWIDPVPQRYDLHSLIDQADVGLALIAGPLHDPNHRSMAGASNKPYDYLARGLAVVVPNQNDWRALFVEPGYGVSCNPNDSVSIAKTLMWLYEHPQERRRMGESGRQRIASEWNYESAFAPILERLGGR